MTGDARPSVGPSAAGRGASVPADGRRAIRIGLTGPIGCGKSTVAGWLVARGAAAIDADAVARDVVEPGEPALELVLGRFGDAVRTPAGGLDRAGANSLPPPLRGWRGERRHRLVMDALPGWQRVRAG